MTTTARTRSRRLTWAVVLLVVGIASAAALGVAVLWQASAASTLGPGSWEGRVVYPEPQPGQDPVPVVGGPARVLEPVPGQPLHLDIPAVGLSANVGAMSIPASRSIDPPTAGSAYWIRDYSAAGASASGTAYIAGHTFRGQGDAVFNALFDRATHAPVILAGDDVIVTTPEGQETYVVTQVVDYDKPDVVNQPELWENRVGRLVIVACQYNGNAPASQNLVVFAELAPANGGGAP